MAGARPGRGAGGRSRRRPGGAPPRAAKPKRADGAPPPWNEWFPRLAPWIALALLGVFAAYWGVRAFHEHRIGNYAVETDFYWKYGPAARDLLQGKVDIANYDSKGWGYPAALALVSLPGLDPYHAGQILGLLSALLAAWLAFHLHRSLLGPGVALGSLLLLLTNQTFLLNTYEVGTDMFFFAVAMGSMALLLLRERSPLAAILGSGLLAGWAFSTRYNGLYLWPGALATILLLDASRSPLKTRFVRSAVWSAAFVVAALPWLLVNAAHTGNPLSNTNYLNVGYEVYGQGNWEQFFYGRDREIHSFADVVMMDPGKFAGVMARNIAGHLRQDLTELLPVLWGVMAAVGAFLLAWDRPGRRTAAYATFGALYFLTVVPVFYLDRFSLPILGLYCLLAVWTFGSTTVGRLFQGIERTVPVRALVFLALWIGPAMAAHRNVNDPSYAQSLASGPYEILPAVEYLREHGTGEALIARKPHAAYLAKMRFVPVPDVRTPAELHAFAAKERVRYVFLSAPELSMRTLMREFVTGAEIPGFALAYESPGALVFEVREIPRIPGGETPTLPGADQPGH